MERNLWLIASMVLLLIPSCGQSSSPSSTRSFPEEIVEEEIDAIMGNYSFSAKYDWYVKNPQCNPTDLLFEKDDLFTLNLGENSYKGSFDLVRATQKEAAKGGNYITVYDDEYALVYRVTFSPIHETIPSPINLIFKENDEQGTFIYRWLKTTPDYSHIKGTICLVRHGYSSYDPDTEEISSTEVSFDKD